MERGSSKHSAREDEALADQVSGELGPGGRTARSGGPGNRPPTTSRRSGPTGEPARRGAPLLTSSGAPVTFSALRGAG